MSDTPETDAQPIKFVRETKFNGLEEEMIAYVPKSAMARMERARKDLMRAAADCALENMRLERERNDARRELQLLLESTKVETCAEPLPERDGEPADFAGAITRMRLAEEERNQWRECAEERKKAWYEMQSAFERSRDEVNTLERERDQWRECASRLLVYAECMSARVPERSQINWTVLEQARAMFKEGKAK